LQAELVRSRSAALDCNDVQGIYGAFQPKEDAPIANAATKPPLSLKVFDVS
jgi:hypothetical protein